MRTINSIAAILALSAAATPAFAAPPTAQSVLDAAYKQAKTQHKTVLILFHASW